MTPPYRRLLTGHNDPVEGGTSVCLFFRQNDRKRCTYNIIERLIKSFAVLGDDASVRGRVIVTPLVR